MADNDGLTEAERAELEQLRAEKAAREEAEKAKKELSSAKQTELKTKVQSLAEADADARDAARRERAREYMEPDEDLKMPAGQKMVLGVIALVVVVMLLMQFFGGR